MLIASAITASSTSPLQIKYVCAYYYSPTEAFNIDNVPAKCISEIIRVF